MEEDRFEEWLKQLEALIIPERQVVFKTMTQESLKSIGYARNMSPERFAVFFNEFITPDIVAALNKMWGKVPKA